MPAYDRLYSIVQQLARAAFESELTHHDFTKIDDNRWDSQHSDFTVTLAGSHVTATQQPRLDHIRAHDVARDMERIVPKLQKQLNRLDKDIHETFQRWYQLPDPTDFDGPLEVLEKGASAIAVGAGSAPGTAIGSAELAGALRNAHSTAFALKGLTVLSFGTQYLAPLPGVIGNIHYLCLNLDAALQFERKMASRARQNVAQIAKQGIVAMEASQKPSTQVDPTTLALTIGADIAFFGAAVAVPALAPVFATSVGISLATAETLLGAAETDAKPQVKLGGGNPFAVHRRIDDALDAIDTSMTSRENRISDGLRTLAKLAKAGGGNFDLRKPWLTSTQRDTNILFEQEGNDLVLSKRLVDEIIGTDIPAITHALLKCRNRMTATSRPFVRESTIGSSPTGVWVEFDHLQETVIDLLNELAQELADAGERLGYAAKHVYDVDGRAGAELQQQINKLDRIGDGTRRFDRTN